MNFHETKKLLGMVSRDLWARKQKKLFYTGIDLKS